MKVNELIEHIKDFDDSKEYTGVIIEKDVLLKAILTYGKPSQAYMAVEECAELIKAINKINREPFSAAALDNLIEELADCFITLMQLKLMVCPVALEKKINEKLIRLEKRLENENAKLC